MFYRKTVLDNGITILSEKMESVRSISIGLWFSVGSRDELPEEAGMSHFMEHMMFKGTPTRNAADISEEFDRLGAELNAFTGKEATCYYARFVDEKLPRAIELFSDMLINSNFLQENVESEREVVIEEIARMEDTPDDYIHELFAAALFPHSTLGKPILGSRETVGGFSHENCLAYHHKHYCTGNMVVAAAGNVDHDELVKYIESAFSALPQGERTKRTTFEDAAPSRLSVLDKVTEQTHIIFGTRGLANDDDDRFAAALMDVVFGGGMSSRLFQEIREKRGLAYAVYSYAQPFIGTGQYGAYVGTRPANTEQAIEVLMRETKRLCEDGITEEELSRARDTVEGRLVLSAEATIARMTKLGRNEVGGVPLLSIEETLERYGAVTTDDVARAARRILSQDTSLAVIGPEVDEAVASALSAH